MTARLWFAALTCTTLLVPRGARAQAPAQPAPQPPAQAPQPATPLTLQAAEQIALTNHPQIQAATDLAAAAKARITEAKSAYYPTAYGSLTGVDAEANSRITAGALNNPIIYDRYAGGVTVSQLVTDFGRTHALVTSSSLHAQAEDQNVAATRADVLLAVDQAYFALLRAQALLTVATQTVAQRQLLSDQVTTLQQNQFKSGLDVDFANVNLAQAKLLLIQAQNGVDAASANLSAALGYPDERQFQLTDQPILTAPPGDVGASVQDALKNRPELLGQQLNASSAHSYASAEHDLKLPTVSAAAAIGVTPSGAAALAPHYAAAGVNVNVPVFNGHLFGALEAEAQAEAKAADATLQDLQDRIVRDVRTAWLDANSAFQRLAVTDQLVTSANQAADLAQSRYTLGLSSIIELSQAQLNQTQAQIDQASARYDYQIALADLAYQTGAIH